MIDPKEVEIVYDYDDILWPCVERITRRLGIDIKIWTDFYASNNQHWPERLIDRANEIMQDPSLFREIEFDDGIEDILLPEELGVSVKINSHSLSLEISELKKEALLNALPKFKPENLQFNQIILNQHTDKQVSANTLVFVDDNPYHILDSVARTNIMRLWPWNTSSAAKQLLRNKRGVHILPDLKTITRYVYLRTKIFLKHGY